MTDLTKNTLNLANEYNISYFTIVKIIKNVIADWRP